MSFAAQYPGRHQVRASASPAVPIRKARAGCPNITQAGLKDWELADFEYLLETGSKPDGDTVGSNMAPVIRNTSQLSPEDRKAMAVYLKSLAPVEGPKRPDGKK